MSIDAPDDELVDEARRSRRRGRRTRSAGRGRRRRTRRCGGWAARGCAVATMSRSMASGVRPACLIAAAPAVDREASRWSRPAPAMRRSRMPVRSTIHASLVSTRLLEVGVGEPLRRGARCPNRRCTARMLRRRGATRWADPHGDVRPGARACPRAAARTGCTPESRCPGPRGADGLAGVAASTPSATSSTGRKMPTAGRRSSARARASPSPWSSRASMGQRTSTSDRG